MIDMDIMEQVAFTEEEAKELKHIILVIIKKP